MLFIVISIHYETTFATTAILQLMIYKGSTQNKVVQNIHTLIFPLLLSFKLPFENIKFIVMLWKNDYMLRFNIMHTTHINFSCSLEIIVVYLSRGHLIEYSIHSFFKEMKFTYADYIKYQCWKYFFIYDWKGKHSLF